MDFINPQHPPDTDDIILNNSFWPDIDLHHYRGAMRTDGTVTPERLRQVVLSAMSEVNAELSRFRLQQELNGFNHLSQVPAAFIAGQSEKVTHYLNAVYCWTRAQLNERYLDYDATASGARKGDVLHQASDELWRDARWAISRVQDAPHCTVELI